MAAASIADTCKYLGALSEKGRLDDSKHYDVKIVTEADLSACLEIVRSTKTAIGRDVIPPMVVICQSSPTA